MYFSVEVMFENMLWYPSHTEKPILYAFLYISVCVCLSLYMYLSVLFTMQVIIL